MIGTLLIIAAVLVYLYIYYENSRGYWIRKNIPGPPSQLLLGNLKELWYTETPRVLVIRDWTKKYGKVYGMHEGQRKILVVSDIDMLNEILVKQFDNFQSRMRFPLQRPEEGPKTHIIEASGARWKRLRTLGTFGFTNKALKQMRETVEDSALIVIRDIESKCEKGEVNMLQYYQEFTMDIICKIALGQKDVEMFNNKYLQICKDVFMSPINNILNVIPSAFPVIQTPMFNFIEFAGKHLKIPFVELMVDLENAVAERKKQREAGQETSSADFIDIYLDAEIEGDNEDVGSRRMVLDEVISQCIIMLLAGFETTSNSLSYLTHFLANYPEVQEKMRVEIERECPGESVEYESLVNLKYTEAVMRESLRHYPLASFVVNRECVKATTVCGYEMEEGDMIMTDTWSLHMDKEIWGEDAEEFRPERWLEESSRPRAAFQSFGEGPRMCIGMRLAYMEEKIVLVHLLKNFVVHASQNTNPLHLVGPLTVCPERVMVRLERRL